jgi:NAD(P)-dependent dehydrogenase (short-subunit alcohol dehydrogenase family)
MSDGVNEKLLPSLRRDGFGHVIFFSPPTTIDQKVNYVNPYLQSKWVLTNYMKSLAFQFRHSDRIGVNSIWTSFPIWTDRQIGKKEFCIHPDLLGELIHDIVFLEDCKKIKGKVIIDGEYFPNSFISKYRLGTEKKYLDDVFLKHLS